MEYKSERAGLLTADSVKDGDKLVITSDAYSTFNATKQKTYWNCKVKLPSGAERLAGLMDSACDAFAAKWGNKTEDWTGHTVVVTLKVSKAGSPYIVLAPADDAKIDVPKSDEGSQDYPPITSEDIPY